MSSLRRSLATAARRSVALAPVFVAVLTLGVALLNVVNLRLGDAVWTLAFGWGFLTPPLALLTWVVLDLSPYDLPWSIGQSRAPAESRRPTSTASDAGASSDATASAADPDDPVAVLRQRYAQGEIDQAEFEQRLDALLATEGVSAADANGDDDADLEPETA